MATSSFSLFSKHNGTWVEANKAYTKVNGIWVEQSNLSNVFQSDTSYQYGGDIIYDASNLTFDGTNYINTGVYLYTNENIDRDFEVSIEGALFQYTGGDRTFICAKHNGLARGFLIRPNNSTNSTYNGTLYALPNVLSDLIVRRINGVHSYEGNFVNHPNFTNLPFDHPLVLGCALDDNGNPYRYATGTMNHICVKWL